MHQYLLFLIKLIYSVSVVGMAIYGLNNLLMVGFYFKGKRKASEKITLEPPEIWPSVTIQLPIFNEKNVIERLLGYILDIDYPPDKLQIQILDDSNDDTSLEVKRLVDIYKEKNVYDRKIVDYAQGLDALLESERIKGELFKFEHDLWEF